MPNPAKWALVDLSGRFSQAQTSRQNYTGSKISLLVNGVSVPVAQFSMEYGLNAIPVASAQIALGRNARTQQESAIYDVVDEIKQMAPVVVQLVGELGDFSASGTGGQRTQFPTAPEPVTIFMGYTSGLSYRRSNGRVSLVINMIGQLFDLACSSGGSKDVVPGSPHDFFVSIYSQGPGGSKYTTAATKFANTLGLDLATDFSSAVLKCLDHISKENFIQTHQGSLWCGGNAGVAEFKEKNEAAANVLNESGLWQGIAGLSTSPYFSTFVGSYSLVTPPKGFGKVAMTISEQMASSLADTSMWGMLTASVLPPFGCGIVPMSRGAIVAPVLPMAREPQISIYPGDYADFNLTTMSRRPLYGVGVLGNQVLGTLNDKNPRMCVGASFVADAGNGQAFTDGMWLFVPAPKWMEDWTNYDSKAIDGDGKIHKMIAKPSRDNAGVDVNAFEADDESDVEDWNSVMEKYAQMMYATQALNGRQGTIVGKMRFDIAPGTTIMIRAKNPTNPLDSGSDTLATDMCAFVARVTTVINAENSSANTTFEVTNLRTAEENKLPRFSLEKHPFFEENYFKYAPIVPELSLPPVV